ncbi:MAG TPA: monofunctional biosynthetic peptidoglycan transglycosylase [Bacteroidetes bacterium]|nr:monofunctional biosynthetic peptidoglycan transglycosylase [Bacteroidota bacterium]HIL57075.1 monofunctional biosynthetic peptidoglycan transglycosylase [Rhodothermales bacterium]
MAARRKAKAPSRWRWLWSPVKWATVALLGYLLACTLLLVAYRWVDPPITTVQIQRYAEAAVAGEPFALQYAPVSEAEQDADARHAVVASEDARFYTHHGFDAVELRAAYEEARAGGGMRGASTLTQQLVKNLFLTTHRSWLRKGLELPLTVLAEWILPKDRILTLYLNSAEMGRGVFGLEAAARHHYGRSASELTRDQAARLAAILPAPLERRPQDMSRTSSRIQTRMRQMGW